MAHLSEQFELLASLIEKPPADAEGLLRLGLDASVLERESADALAAEHYRVLTHDMMPVASAFLEPDGMLGGQVSEQVWAMMDASGFRPETSSYAADHLSNELRFLGFLVRNELLLKADEFYIRHLSSWLPILRYGLRRSESSYFEQIEQALEKTVSKVAIVTGIPNEIATEQSSERISYTYPPLPTESLDLDNDRSGLADIGRFLATTPESGLHVSKTRLAVVARSLRLPTGFGSRARLVEGMLRSAGQYDALSDVCDFFDAETQHMDEVWKREQRKGEAHWAKAWAAKLTKSRKVTDRLRGASALADWS